MARGQTPAALQFPLLLASFVAMAVGMIGCGPDAQEPDRPWNVLLVTFDTTRADRIGCYGNERIQTPTLDALAASGIRYASNMSAVPITAPSHSTILTGRYPIAHGVRDNGLFVLGDEQLTLAEILRDRGYATAAAVGAFPVTAQFGLNQGFSLFDDHLTGAFEDYLGRRVVAKDRLFFDERRAAQVNEAVMPWIEAHAEEPFFTWVHYFDPHQPFEPPPPFDQLYADDLYNGEIAYADSRLGLLLEFLDELGVLDRTLVVMTADHGEGRGEHNEETHAVLAYGSTLHVPLIFRPPPGTAPEGVVVEDRVGTVDIVPTILDFLGIEAPDGIQGRSLVPLWDSGNEALEPRQQYAENISTRLTHGWAELRVLFEGPYKYIHGPSPQLFDLTTDPHERMDLAAERPDDVARMRSDLQRFLDEKSVSGISTTQTLDDDVRARLEALGYLHSGGESEEQIVEQLRDDGISPQERVGDVNDLSAAKHLLFLERYPEALEYTKKLVKNSPDSPLYLELQASTLSALGRLDEAWEVAGRLERQGKISEPLYLRLAVRRFEEGERETTASDLERYLSATPSAQGSWVLASFRDRLGRPDLAMESIRQALELDPELVPARVDLGVHLAQARDPEAAEEEFLRALEDGPYHAKAQYNYGTFLLQSGRYQEAASRFRRAIALSPRYLKAHLALVATHVALGQGAEAQAAYQELARLAPGSPEAATAADLIDSTTDDGSA